jgi:hypothetical protein
MLCCLLLLIAFACGDLGDATLDVSAPPPVAVRIPYELHGIPGPWWRDNATQGDFDRDLWACRTESKRSRQGATSETRKDVAYRAFLDCMTRLAWTRGHPPDPA